MQYDREIYLKILLSDPPPKKGQSIPSAPLGYRGSLEVEKLHMSFTVVKTLGINANTAQIRVWNLRQSTRKQLENFGDQIRIFAGYKENGGAQLLFTGNSTQVSHLWAEPEFISTFNCGDGERTLNNRNLNISFAPNTSAETVLREMATRLQMEIAYFAPHENKVYSNGFQYIGNAKKGLDIVATYLNLLVTVQNDNLYIVPQNNGIQKEPIEINSQTGMLGIPERYTDLRGYYIKVGPKTGWKVQTLLNPFIIPGDIVRIKSTKADMNGLFYVEKITHTGDNFGADFTSLLEVVAV